MSKAKDSSTVQELATESTDSNQAPAIEKAKTPNYVQGVYADVPIRTLKSDRDRSRTLRRARKRLRAARRRESRTEKQRVERHKTVPENRSKLLY